MAEKAEVGRGIQFKPFFEFGDLVQIAVLLLVGASIWYALVGDVSRNRQNIELNTKSIIELRAANRELLETVNMNAERREARMMIFINKIMDDMSWLVRREADQDTKK